MKRSELQDLRARSLDDLRAEVEDARKQLMFGRFGAAVEGQGLGAKARLLRRHIARCQTIITQKQKAEVKA